MPADPRYRAVLIGNAAFLDDPHALPRLRGPLVDITELGQALTDDEVGLFPVGNIQSLPDAEVHELRKRLDTFFATAAREDVLLLYYSGHGRLDENGGLYLCARDTALGTLRATALSAAEINNMIRGSAAACVVIVLDCCHSGAWKASVDLAAPIAGKGRYVLTSNRATQLARDAEAEGRPSPFTEMLVRGLRHADAAGNLTVGELYRQVHRWTTEEFPRPPQLNFVGEGDVVIARRRKARRRKRAFKPRKRRPLAQHQADPDRGHRAAQLRSDKADKAKEVFRESWTGDEDPTDFSEIRTSSLGLLYFAPFPFLVEGAAILWEKTGQWGFFGLVVMFGIPLLYVLVKALAYLVLRSRIGDRSLQVDAEGITVADSFGEQHIPWTAIAAVGVRSAAATSDSRTDCELMTLHIEVREPTAHEPPLSLYRTVGWPRGSSLPSVCRGPEPPRPGQWVPVCVLGPMPEPRRIALKNAVMTHGRRSLDTEKEW